MPSRSKPRASSDDDEEEYTSQVATSAKKGKRSRQVVNDDSESDHAPPAKRRTPATKSKPRARRATSEPSGEEDVDVEGTDSDTLVAPSTRQRSTSSARRDDHEDDDVADTDSSHLSSPDPSPARKQTATKPERSSKSKLNRIDSDEEGSKSASPAPPQKPPRPPVRQDSTSKPLRKPVAAGSRSKEKEKDATPSLSTIPSIPRRPKDALATIKDTQDMDLLNKDVYNQLFNTSATSKPIAKSAHTEAKQKEINAKRQAAKSALLKARESTFDLQLPTDKVLAFEASFYI
ncbi:hypothetical protein RhiJN_01002 [Ceratobasidium sp. AG-Ba]|nr:hypothetical protein RhiJN_01002 [Ceratobasidium sp. AG-Ba]QRW02032.1 hypothetical protein RhiLY_01029 [Ceratobasidium sp. AG-Ba]